MATRTQLREQLRQAKFRNEADAVADLLSQPGYSGRDAEQIESVAAALVRKARDPTLSRPLLDTFLTEYGLSNAEGVALMCLAESLLRIPDWDTADLLIADKLSSADWSEHLGNADSLLVNASTWALMLTGRVVELHEDITNEPRSWFQRLVNRISEPVVQTAIRSATEILGREFVLGETIDSALKRCSAGELYSFDMLGEGARDATAAQRYLERYHAAIEAVGNSAEQADATISIKLSALHPRYQHSQIHRVMSELLPRIKALSDAAGRHGLRLTIDAEEADRLDLSLSLFEALVVEHQINNIGFVVQAYSRRATKLLDWLIELATDQQLMIPIRLVKGAYWDAEIKHAQVEGVPDFPVYTRKENTDLSYLVCARKILDRPDALYGQFATHNAHTVAAVMHMGAGKDFEFQRLHGMGEILYDTARGHFSQFPPVRTYAPVGAYQDLLAYLVRRLLENGANSSFVNRFLDADVPPEALVQDPLTAVRDQDNSANSRIRLPTELFDDRANSIGMDLTDSDQIQVIEAAIKTTADTLTPRPAAAMGDSITSRAPYDRDLCVGEVHATSNAELTAIITKAVSAQPAWNRLGSRKRAEIINACADALEAAVLEIIPLLVHEAGKSIPDALNELREAVDFCRYYAAQALHLSTEQRTLPGPTGETNLLTLDGRGVWACISPWNFPLAIFLGQVSAALVTGNTVVAKPSEETPLIAAECVSLLNAAGLPEDVCQLVLGDGDLGAALTADPAIAGVAFTGSTDTARKINQTLARSDGPIRPLVAETGGQNAMIVDSTALLEQVTDDVIESAFASAGQRCSALRVLFVQQEIADELIDTLIGAMDELTIGYPGLLATDIGPVISADARAALNEHIDSLKRNGRLLHQSTLHSDCDRGHFVAPTLAEIREIDELTREHFGPILHLIRFDADQLDQVVDAINRTGFGLTFGIHTRINARAEAVSQQIQAGNIYVNRNMIGAVVGVQPFGGRGLSGTGPKAGGPHYLSRFTTEKTLTINTVATGGNAELLNL